MISFREKRTSGDFQELIQHREKSKTVQYEMREMCVFKRGKEYEESYRC